VSGQYVAYTFFKIDPAWRRLPIDERAAGKDAFAEVVEDWAGRMDTLRAYSVAGVRPDCDFFLWKITERYEDLGELGAALNGTPLAGWQSGLYYADQQPKASLPAFRKAAVEARNERLTHCSGVTFVRKR
jgi:chlorite dismutase